MNRTPLREAEGELRLRPERRISSISTITQHIHHPWTDVALYVSNYMAEPEWIVDLVDMVDLMDMDREERRMNKPLFPLTRMEDMDQLGPKPKRKRHRPDMEQLGYARKRIQEGYPQQGDWKLWHQYALMVLMPELVGTEYFDLVMDQDPLGVDAPTTFTPRLSNSGSPISEEPTLSVVSWPYGEDAG